MAHPLPDSSPRTSDAPALERLHQVTARVGLAKSTLYRLIEQGAFPPLYVGNRSLISRLKVPLDTSRYCLGNIGALLAGRAPLDPSIQFSRAAMRFYASLNLTLVCMVTAVYGLLLVKSPDIFVFYVGLPALAANLYWSIHPYIEHGGTDASPGTMARNCTSPVYRLLLLGYTYHLCHHLYPRVQTHKLPALERHLRRIGYFDADTPNEPRFIGAIRIGLTKAITRHS